MKKLIPFLVIVLTATYSSAQMDIPSIGFSPRATISEEVGITSISLDYSRPGVKGREGKIWGALVPYGFAHYNFLENKPASPWRAGANEATTISIEHDVKIEGKDLQAGTYALFMAMDTHQVTLIFSKQVEAWGSYNYQEADDVLRVHVKPIVLDQSVEWLKYEFIEHTESSCVIAMQWENLSVPFRVDVDVHDIVLARIREEFKGVKGFISANRIHAAMYCFEQNINMEEALTWAKRAITGQPFGQSSFDAYLILAQGYEQMNRTSEADATIDEGLAVARLDQYLSYSKQLIQQDRAKRSIQVGLDAQQKFGDILEINQALTHAYSAQGDYQTALEYANKALAQTSKGEAQNVIMENIAKLKNHEDINP